MFGHEPYVAFRLSYSFLARVTQLREVYKWLHDHEHIPSLKARFERRIAQCDKLRVRLMERRIQQLGL